MNLNFFKSLFLENNQLSQIIFKNTSWMLLANIIAKLFKFGMMIIVARELGPSLFGNFNYIIVLSAMCFILSDIGLNLLIIREFQEKKKHIPTLIATGLSIKLLLISMNIIIACIFYFFIDPLLKLPFIIFSSMNIIDGIKQYWITLNRAHLKQEYEGISFIIETTLTSILSIFIVLNSTNIIYLALAYFSGSLFSGIYLYIKTKAIMHPISNTCMTQLIYLLKKMAPFTISIFLATAITSIDTLMIQWMLNPEAVGLYSSGLKISDTIIIIPTIFGSVLFPFLTQFQNQPQRLFKILQESLAILFMMACPIFLGGIYLASDIIQLIFSSSYGNATTTFQYLLGASVLIFWFIPINGLLLATKLENKCIKNSSVGCLANIGLNLMLIPELGIVGAGIGTLFGRMLLLILHIITIKKVYPTHPIIIKQNLHYIAFSIIMLITIFICKKITSNTVLLILSGITSYFFLIIIMKDPSIKKIKTLFHNKKETIQ